MRSSWTTPCAGPLAPGPPVPDHGGVALGDLLCFAEPGLLAQLHVAVHIYQWDAVLHTQQGDQLLGHELVAVHGQDAEQSLALVQSPLRLPETMGIYSSRKTLSLLMLRCYPAQGPETAKSQARPGVNPIKHPHQKMN